MSGATGSVSTAGSVTSAAIAQEAAKLRIDSSVVPPATWELAVRTELEHSDVTRGDLGMVSKIALAHLREDPYYYSVLARTEPTAEEYWSQRGGPPPVQLGGAEESRLDWRSGLLRGLALAVLVLLLSILVRWLILWVLRPECPACSACPSCPAHPEPGTRFWGAQDPENIILFSGRDRRDPRDMSDPRGTRDPRGYWGPTPWPGWPSYDPAMIADSTEQAFVLPGRA